MYDLRLDPKEHNNVLDAEPKVARVLGSRVKHHIQFEAEIESMAEKKRLRIASRG